MESTLTAKEISALFELFSDTISYADGDCDDTLGIMDPFDAVMVLSAPPTIGRPINTEINSENHARILYAIKICKRSAEFSGVDWQNFGTRDWCESDQNCPMLYINALTEQLNLMLELAKIKYPASRIKVIDCGNLGVGNTLTQFKAIAENSVLADEFRKYKRMAIVTSAYHVPRVTLTAKKWIADIACKVSVEPVPLQGDVSLPFDVLSFTKELARIIEYYGKGDIARPGE